MTTKKTKLIVEQNPDKPVDVKVLATVIVAIGDSMKKLLASGLNRKAIIALIKDRSGLTKGTIEIVLNNLESLKDDYCR